MPYKIKKAIMAIKVEAVSGTPETLAAADAFRASDISIDDDVKMAARSGVKESSLSPLGDVAGPKIGKISFKIELKGSGAAGTAPEYGECLKAAGMSETIVAVTSVTYKPSDQASTYTLAVYEDGVKYFIAGACGTVKFSCKHGEIMVAEFEMTGLYQEPLLAAMLASTSLDTTTPKPFIGATATTWNAIAMIIADAEFDLANTVTMRPDVSKTNG